jgi:hypothetical protein
MFAKRKTLAASGAEIPRHGAEDAPASLEDALACLAEQGAARSQARQCWGSFSQRRRWRFVARLTGKCPRISKFHNTHPTAARAKPRAATLRHADLCSSILHRGACADLIAPPLHIPLVPFSTIIS